VKMGICDWPFAASHGAGLSPTPGDEHTITSRAIDTAGNIQPAMNDPSET